MTRISTKRRRLPLAAATVAVVLALSMAAMSTSSSAGLAAAGPVPWLHVSGNEIKDSAGNSVTLRGVSILAPEQNNLCTTCNSKPINDLIDMTIDANAGWHSRVLRLLVTEVHRYDINTYFTTYIKPHVDHAISKGIYVIIDFHYVRNFSGTDALPQSVVMDFWNYIAPIYASTPNVIFEVFNEPISPDSWITWKSYIQPVVDSIRAVAPNNLILMGNPQWSTRVNEAVTNPITGGNIVYVYHIYPNQGPATAANLDPRFGNAANSIPIMVTEFGWNPPGPYSDCYITRGTTSEWGAPFREYIDARPHISWTAWIFDNFWMPQMFDVNWNLLTGEHQGAFIRNWLYEMRDNRQPSSSPSLSSSTGLSSSPLLATDLALNKPVTVSSVESSSFPGSAAVDGDPCTRWSSQFSDPQWISVDLGQSYAINQVRLTWEAAFGSAYEVQTSPDGASWTTIRAVSGGDGGVDDLTSLTGTGRYARIYGTARGTVYGYSLFSFEVYGTSTPPPPTVLFQDDFEDGNASGWTTAGGIWTVKTNGSKVYAQSATTGEAIAHAGSSNWSDYTYQARVRLNTTNGNAGLLLRYSDASNFYMFRLNDNGDKVDLYKRVGGTLTLVASAAQTIHIGQFYTLKVTVTGNNIKAYVDGVQKIDWTNSVTQLSTGKIGLRMHTSTARFDDVVVSQ